MDSGRPSHRVLVLGAGGWFGRTTLNLLRSRHPSWRVLPMTARARTVRVGSTDVHLHRWDIAFAMAWRPSLIINCAFLTRDKLRALGFDSYVANNRKITEDFIRILEMPSLTGALTISSGVALNQNGQLPLIGSNPYGHLKRQEEIRASTLAQQLSVPLVIVRAWSVSGPFVQRPRDYAFSDLISQAQFGLIKLRAGHPVWRRYASVADVMTVSVAHLLEGWSGTIDSGGELIELRELSARVISALGVTATVEETEPDGSPPDSYFSDGKSWDAACIATNHRAMTLHEQIMDTARVLVSSPG